MGKPSLAARFPQLVAELTAPAAHGGRLGVNRYLHEVWSRRPDLRLTAKSIRWR